MRKLSILAFAATSARKREVMAPTQHLDDLAGTIRRAPVVPMDRLRVNPAAEPVAKYVYGEKDALADVVSLSLALEQAKALLAAAPTPPEAVPVQLPDCVGKVLSVPDDDGSISWRGGMPPQPGTMLYTEQQVRQILTGGTK